MLELSTARSTARSILEEVSNQCGEGYTVIRIGYSANNIALGKDGSIFSIVKSPDDLLQSAIAANEKSLSDQRDLSSSADGWNELIHIFSDVDIQPAQEYLKGGEIKRDVRDRGLGVGGAKSTVSTSSKPVKKGKETTAAAFFGKTTKKEAKPAAVKEVKGKENNKSAESKAAPKKEESKSKETKPTKQSANVDDFMGDEDEDDEFLQQESERKARVAREARKEVRANVIDTNAKKRNTGSLSERRKMNPEKGKSDTDVEMEEKKNSDDEVEYDDCVKKPMDAFAKRTASTAGGAKKRRKKLVEKTVMENGYLKTVTEEVWEEYEEEEEAPAKPAVKAAPKPAVKKSGGNKGKKQGSLMGFFAKK